MVEVIGLDWHSKSSSSHAITTLSAVWWRQFFDRQLAIATRVQSIITQYSTIDIRPHSDYYSSVYIRVPHTAALSYLIFHEKAATTGALLAYLIGKRTTNIRRLLYWAKKLPFTSMYFFMYYAFLYWIKVHIGFR